MVEAFDCPVCGGHHFESSGQSHRQWRETSEASVDASWACSFKKRITQAVDAWRSKAGHAASLLLRSLENKSDQWWYFLDHPEVPPDNNRAERSLRLVVTKRKVCGGSRSWEGFRRSAKLLTVIQSCRAQGRSAVNFFRQAISLAARGRSPELSGESRTRVSGSTLSTPLPECLQSC